MATFSEEQVIALAPDESSAKAGRDLANSRKWVSFGANEVAAWGECQGSGSKPYQTCIDTSEPAFKCSCPSRKFPCKHGLGLMLFLARESKTFEGKSTPPAWVSDWLNNRQEKAEKKQKKKEEKAEAPVNPIAQAKRQAERMSKVNAGLSDFSLWLQDRIRQGLAGLSAESYQFWENQAARLTDAQAPGLARMLRQCGGIPYSGEGWQSRLLDRLSLMHMAVEGFQKLDELPEAVRHDLRTVVGFTVSQDDVLQQSGLLDRWQILGQRTEVEEKLKVQRTWLRGVRSGNWALILNFAHGMQPLDVTMLPGLHIDAELCYFPGAVPLRALVKSSSNTGENISEFSAYKSASDFLDSYASALAANPFLESFPMALENLSAFMPADGFQIVDCEGVALPAARIPAALQWQILAISGGHKFSLFAEFWGERILPLSMIADGNYYRLDQRLNVNVT